MGTPHRWPLAVLQVPAVLGILVCGVVAAVIRFVHRSLTPALVDFFDATSEVANATNLSIATMCAYCASRMVRAWPAAQRWLPWWEHFKQGNLLMLLTRLMSGLITLALKHVVGRARPSVLIEPGHYRFAAPFAGALFNSLPFSHAFTAIAAACVLARVLPAWRTPLLVLPAGWRCGPAAADIEV